eukprot:11771168-Alexandrium_andersonii.AAC.1
MEGGMTPGVVAERYRAPEVRAACRAQRLMCKTCSGNFYCAENCFRPCSAAFVRFQALCA